ncbi:MAG: hypothetical protein Q8L27_00735 [archaeon]|nr:hypothetical protein [archaeon]
MELKKIESKKAQEFSITTLVVLVLAVIVLVIVILGFWKGWDYIFGKVGLLPGNLEAVAQSCSGSGQAGLVTSYCYEFKSVTVNGVKQYMNCETLRSGYAEVTELEGGCTDITKIADAENALCVSLKKEVKINERDCKKSDSGDWAVV